MARTNDRWEQADNLSKKVNVYQDGKWEPMPVSPEEFNRLLEEAVRQAQEAAWEAGYSAGYHKGWSDSAPGGSGWYWDDGDERNPYRSGS